MKLFGKKHPFFILLLFLGLTVACRLQPTETATPRPATTISQHPSPTFSPTATQSPPLETSTITPTIPPTATTLPTSFPNDLAIAPDKLLVYPVPHIVAGDFVTFQVAAFVPENLSPNNVIVRLQIENGPTLEESLDGRNLGGDAIGRFEWAWQVDRPGNYQVTVSLDPDNLLTIGDENGDNNEASFTVTVEEVSRPEPTWITAETTHAIVHVVSNTAAHRDLEQLKSLTDQAIQQAIDKLGEQPHQKLNVYFIDRVIGQGGYAGSAIVVSYLDRDYAGGTRFEVLVHEAAHLLDRQFAPNRLTPLAEGLALWASGGHYKQENLDQRSAALRQTGLYIPLADLLDNFYPTQHEIGYLEMGGLLSYLVNTYSWPQVRQFYIASHYTDQESPAQTINRTMLLYFNKDLTQIEQDWFVYLENHAPDSVATADLLTTVRYYNVMRDYQLAYDPTAHFLQAWLPSPQGALDRQITADLTRHPAGEINITFETMLIAVNEALLAGQFEQANALLDSIERALDSGHYVDPLSLSYNQIVQKLTQLGFIVQRITLNGDQAIVFANNGTSIYLSQLNLILRNQDWILTN